MREETVWSEPDRRLRGCERLLARPLPEEDVASDSVWPLSARVDGGGGLGGLQGPGALPELHQRDRQPAERLRVLRILGRRLAVELRRLLVASELSQTLGAKQRATIELTQVAPPPTAKD
jgi:hypothetical protein